MSTVRTNNVQVGQSATATNNFTLYQPTVPDGTVRLGVGNTGVTTLDAVTVTSAGNVGIGTSSPTLNTNGTVLHINNSTASRAAIVHMTNAESGSSSADGLIVGKWSDGTNYVFDYDAYPLVFGTNSTERMRIDTSGNVGIGTSSPLSDSRMTLTSSTANKQLAWTDATNGTAWLSTGTGASRIWSNVALAFGSGSETFTERARIDSSGNLLVGITSTGSTPTYGAAYIAGDRSVGSGNYYAQVFVPHNSTTNHGIVVKELAASGIALAFLNSSNSVVGSITTTNTATAYNTSSDYRLKENIAPMTGALAKVAALKPCTYNWKADGSDGEGFIAHELAEVVPQCVTGEKDAVDENGNPQYQGIDTSFLVATLTAAIQELKAELDSVKTELAALKGAQA